MRVLEVIITEYNAVVLPNIRMQHRQKKKKKMFGCSRMDLTTEVD